MKQIKLTQNKYAIVDDDAYEALSKYKWYAARRGYGFYAQRMMKGKTVLMHRIILNAPKGKDVDHMNGNTLDNRKENIRICGRSQNEWNRGKQKNNTTGFKGVTLDKEYGGYKTRIRVFKKLIYIGKFDTAVEAGDAYNFAALKYHGEFANLNKI